MAIGGVLVGAVALALVVETGRAVVDLWTWLGEPPPASVEATPRGRAAARAPAVAAGPAVAPTDAGPTDAGPPAAAPRDEGPGAGVVQSEAMRKLARIREARLRWRAEQDSDALAAREARRAARRARRSDAQNLLLDRQRAAVRAAAEAREAGRVDTDR